MSSWTASFAARFERTSNAFRACLLVLMCLLAFIPGISGLPPTDRDESRYMQATKQMVETGDYVDIRFQTEPRYLKPVGIYWMQSAAIHLIGNGAASAPWVYRLVSVFSMTVAVLATFFIGLWLFGSSAGFLAATAMIGLVMVGFEARIAKTDAALLAATTIAMGALGVIYVAARRNEKTPWFAPWVFWLAQGVGILIKGPITPLAAGLTVIALSLWDRDWRWLTRLRAGPGVILMALVALPWLAAITIKSGWTFWSEALDRSLFSKVRSGQESHGFPPGYYTLIFSLFAFPFAAEMLRAGLKAINIVRTDPRLAFLLAWYVPYWLVFEAIPTKLPHYVLPIYPAALLLMAWALADQGEAAVNLKRWQQWLVTAARLTAIVIAIVLAIGVAALVPYTTGTVSVAGLAAALFILAAGWFGSGYAPALPAMPRIAAASAAAAAAFGLTTQFVAPAAHTLWLGQRIAEAFEAHRPCPHSVLISSGFLEPSLVFLAGTGTVLASPGGAAAMLAANPACGIVAVRSDQQAAFFTALPSGEASVNSVGEVSALDYTKGFDRSIRLYVMKAR